MSFRGAVTAGLALFAAAGEARADPLETAHGMGVAGVGFVSPLGTTLGAGVAPRLVDRLYLPADVEAVLRGSRWGWSTGIGAAYFFDWASVRGGARYRRFRRERTEGLLSDETQTLERSDAGFELAGGLVWRQRRTLLGLEAGKYFPVVTFRNERVFRDHRTGETVGTSPGPETDATELRWFRAYVGFVF